LRRFVGPEAISRPEVAIAETVETRLADAKSAAAPLEIERKFLVHGKAWKEGAEAVSIRQGYLASGERAVVRIRLKGDRGILTIKGRKAGISRLELEYETPTAEAETLLDLCEGSLIEKTRYLKTAHGKLWEIDVFEGRNLGLIVAEIELEAEDETFEVPDWVTREVSDDPRYANAALSQHPFTDWTD